MSHTTLAGLDELTQMLQIPCPSGREERMAAHLTTQLQQRGASPRQDGQGNVWVDIPGRESGPGVAIASHTDEIAMVVTAIAADGTLRLQRSGGLYPFKLGEGPVVLIGTEEDVPAHLSFGSGHTSDPTDPVAQFNNGTRGITWPDCHLLTGLSPQDLAARGVRVGTCAVPAATGRGPTLFGPPEDPLVSAWLFDNRGGSLTLLQLWSWLREAGITPRRTLQLCFMVQEETGLLGAKGWVRRNEVECFVAVDSTPMPRGTDLTLDGRPATWSRDSHVHFDQGLISDLATAAQRAGTELQYAVYAAAASDATGVLQAGGAERCATIGYPRENSHGYEVVRWSVFRHLTATLGEWVASY
ncbi:MAG: M20/M25/M40 family metallo-hydrolase [bacterium]|nr:M20/M25/M40 family metallo-hydrolase [bacterium]